MTVTHSTGRTNTARKKAPAAPAKTPWWKPRRSGLVEVDPRRWVLVLIFMLVIVLIGVVIALENVSHEIQLNRTVGCFNAAHAHPPLHPPACPK